MQGSLASIFIRDIEDTRSVRRCDELLRHQPFPLSAGEHQRRHAALVCQLRLGAARLQQRLHGSRVSSAGSSMQGSLASILVGSVWIGTAHLHHLHHSVGAPLGSHRREVLQGPVTLAFHCFVGPAAAQPSRTCARAHIKNRVKVLQVRQLRQYLGQL